MQAGKIVQRQNYVGVRFLHKLQRFHYWNTNITLKVGHICSTSGERKLIKILLPIFKDRNVNKKTTSVCKKWKQQRITFQHRGITRSKPRNGT